MPRQGRRGLHTECPHVACLGYICIYVSSWFGSVLHVLIGAVFICIIRASDAIMNQPWTRCPSDLEYNKHVHTIFLSQNHRIVMKNTGSVTSAPPRASDTLSTVSTSSEISYTSKGESTIATSNMTYISSTGTATRRHFGSNLGAYLHT